MAGGVNSDGHVDGAAQCATTEPHTATAATARRVATTASSSSSAGQPHYEEVAASYDAAFFYSSIEYRDWVLGHLLRHMRLPDESASIVDLGGGTGNFSQAVAEASGSAARVLCVDAFAEMLEKAVGHGKVEPMLCDAVAFAQLPPSEMRYSHVLLKELVHHIPAADIPSLYAGLHAQLAPGGVAVTITRPQDVDYPLFKRAHEIWKENQPHHSAFTGAMEAAGFQVEAHAHDYPATLPKLFWLSMVRARFWSTFSHCTPVELEQGVAELEAQYAGQEEVQFTDRLLFLVGRKKELGAAAAGGGAPAAAERGFAGPLRVLSADEAAAAAVRYDRYAAALGGGVSGDYRFKSHLLLPWVWQLAAHPRLVAAVSQALGGCRNLLCWSADWFLKQPGDGAFTGWHQDSTYVGLDPPDVVTAWLALTPSGPDNGCLHFAPGTHWQQLPHVDTFAEGNLLLKGQTIPELAGIEGECIPLAPGEATLHHIRLAHRSGPAAPGSHRRLGLALRYMAAHVRQSLDPRDCVTVVAGRDSFGLHRLEAPPAGELDAAARAEHARAVPAVYPEGLERGQGGQ
ncbi:phytanoyl-dioxygenase [Micractinium conductrix]|uniref:Phytanoyl-dioxygenase n=1 Tax=Micractinium conductrix TaxID=554055 RepID=A0A2P6V8A6_9CHLO|nr:phytanoyl-dioxygenase [Micractinium conductrix]|eukprot:PSC70320.1 phytanoyl-dioxygenase [Micractinium conductrix]